MFSHMMIVPDLLVLKIVAAASPSCDCLLRFLLCSLSGRVFSLKRLYYLSLAVMLVLSNDALLAVPRKTLEEILRRLEDMERTVQEILAELSLKSETSAR